MPFRAVIYTSHVEMIILGAHRWHRQRPKPGTLLGQSRNQRRSTRVPAQGSRSNGDKGATGSKAQGSKSQFRAPTGAKTVAPGYRAGGRGAQLTQAFL